MANINRVVLVGNLTRDPELRHTPSGMAVCSLRLAVNTRRKDEATGEWAEKPNYFDITVWGNAGRELRAVPREGPPRRRRRPARVARVGGAGRHEAPGGRGHRRHRPVPRRSRRGVGGGAPQYVPASATAPTNADFGGRRRRRHPVLGRDEWLREQTNARRASDQRGARKRAQPGRSSASRCFFCKDKVDEIDYKNINQLRRYISEKGKIRNRRITGACRRHQRQVAVAVKRAREMALLPYVTG